MPDLTYDQGAEEMMIGALLLRNDLMEFELNEKYFFVDSLRTIFQVILKQHVQNKHFGLHTVMMDLRLMGKPELCPSVAGCLSAYCAEEPMHTGLIDVIYSRLSELYRTRESKFAIAEANEKIDQGVDKHFVQMELNARLDAINSTAGESNLPSLDELVLMLESANIPTGYKDLDARSGGLTKNDLTILAARPSVGKSALARGIISHFVKQDKRVYWLSQDQSLIQIVQLEAAKQSRLPVHQLLKLTDDEKRQKLEALLNFWKDNLVLVDKPIPISQIVTDARNARPDLIVVDYLQIMNTGLSDEYESVTVASKTLKNLAQELEVPVLALAQFNRQHKPGQPPSLSWLRGSGQIEQDAAQVWALDRDTSISTSENQKAEIHILKNKTGPTGSAFVTWVGKYASYEQFAPIYEGSNPYVS